MDIPLSVIVPIYNGGEYIEKNLITLASQTLENIEIICVNNNSTDNTLNILKAYEKVFPDKFVIIDSPSNDGPGGGRNIGLKYARGKYIGFMDHDDHVSNNMYKEMYEKAEQGNFDIVKCGFYDKRNEKNIYIPDISGVLDDEKRYLYITDGFYIWNKIYKRSLIESMSMHFRENIFVEDVDFYIEAVLRAEKVSNINKPFYFYNFSENTSSRTNKISINRIYHEDEEAFKSIKKRISLSPHTNVGERVREYIIKEILKPLIEFVWASPDFSQKTINRFYDFAQKYMNGFYNLKYENTAVLSELIWNNLCEDREQCYKNLVTFMEKVKSGELDEEINVT